MESSLYWIGVILALLAGWSHYSGLIIEKVVINKLDPDAKLMKNLVRTPKWLLAIFIRFGIGSIFFMFAQFFIGPAIIPGLMSSGLIILAIGSIKIIGENLKLIELLAIAMMITAITLIGFSELSIDLAETNLLEIDFIVRISISTVIMFLLALLFQFLQIKIEKFRGILLALISGLMFSLSNYWISPLLGVIAHIFSGTFIIPELVLFLISSAILIVVNVYGVTKMAASFRYGKASNLVPLQNVPVQLSPSILYFLVFNLAPPSIFSVIFFMISVILIIACSFILGKRQAQIDKID
ncbi:MAG: hypothetical protein ACFE85_06720 [Candidatus Hodarchaeota archaeon]